MFRSISYKGDAKPADATTDFYDATGKIPSRPTSCPRPTIRATRETRYRDYSLNFKLGDTTNIKSTSVFFYAAELESARRATTTDAMIRSISYKGDAEARATPRPTIYDATGKILVDADVMSETYYKGDKGDEVSDYSLNFKLGDTTNIKSTSVFFYAAELESALTRHHHRRHDPVDLL